MNNRSPGNERPTQLYYHRHYVVQTYTVQVLATTVQCKPMPVGVRDTLFFIKWMKRCSGNDHPAVQPAWGLVPPASNVKQKVLLREYIETKGDKRQLLSIQ
jgi:hypothetical protein